jgi:hypothetical protein
MLTIYDVSRHEDELLRVNDSPYGVLPCGSYCRFTGQAFLQHESPAITIFRADEQAGVDGIQLCIQAENGVQHTGLVIVKESDEIEELRQKAKDMKTDLDIFGDQEKVVTNLFPAYDREHPFSLRFAFSDCGSKAFSGDIQNSRRRTRKNKQMNSMMSWISSLHFGKRAITLLNTC